MFTTLPQPKLVDLGMPWVVRVGSLGFNNAFEGLHHALEFAQRQHEMGTKVSVGHAAHGWVDLLDLNQDHTACMQFVGAWADDRGAARPQKG
jgi:hypothetical protein